MDRPTLEVAEIFRRHGEAYRREAGVSPASAQGRVMTAIETWWGSSWTAWCSLMLSGFLIVWLGFPHTNVAIWLPGILLLDELLLMAPNRAQRLRYAAMLAIVVAVQFTGGHAETSADVLVPAATYHVFRWGQAILPGEGSLRRGSAVCCCSRRPRSCWGRPLHRFNYFPFSNAPAER